MDSKRKIVEILEKYDAKPIKKLGQNFIINKQVVKKITSCVDFKNNIIEIGPGLGTLTLELSQKLRQFSKKKKIIAVEKDVKMVEILKETLVDCNNVSVVHQDALVFIKNLKMSHYEVIACLPYYVATPIIRLFLETDYRPERMVLTVQKEVAQRICAKPPDMSLLAVSVQFYAQPKILFKISKNSFWPQPQVDSSVIEIVPCKNFTFEKKFIQHFFKTLKAGFSRPRGQLLNNLTKKLKLEKETVEQYFSSAGINSKRRAETLSVEEWIRLSSSVFF